MCVCVCARNVYMCVSWMHTMLLAVSSMVTGDQCVWDFFLFSLRFRAERIVERQKGKLNVSKIGEIYFEHWARDFSGEYVCFQYNIIILLEWNGKRRRRNHSFNSHLLRWIREKRVHPASDWLPLPTIHFLVYIFTNDANWKIEHLNYDLIRLFLFFTSTFTHDAHTEIIFIQ